MNTADINRKLVDSYVGLLKNLSIDNKLDVISKLTQSMKSSTGEKETKFYEAFGAWDEQESAEQLIHCIRDARTFDRNIEAF